MPLCIGLTGGIGSGKTLVGDTFAELGVEVADADAVSHRLTEPGAPGLLAITSAFGPSILLPSGALDRAALRRRVFSEPAERARLESILHPLIAAEMKHEIDAWQGPYGIVVIPLLLEKGRSRGYIDRVLVVDCPEEVQVQRVVQRSGLAPEEVRAIMATQLSRAKRLAAADDVLDNAQAPQAAVEQVRVLDRLYRKLACEAQGA